MNIEHKLQRLHALRLQRAQLDAEIREAEYDTRRGVSALASSQTGRRPSDVRGAVFVETPPVKHEQDLGSWARRLADVEDL